MTSAPPDSERRDQAHAPGQSIEADHVGDIVLLVAERIGHQAGPISVMNSLYSASSLARSASLWECRICARCVIQEVENDAKPPIAAPARPEKAELLPGIDVVSVRRIVLL